MKTIKLTLCLMLIMAIAPFVTGQEIQTNKIAKFSAISLQGNLEVTLKKGDAAEYKVELTNCSNDSFLWDVKNGVFTVKLKPKLFAPAKEPKPHGKMTIYYTDINSIKVDGSKIFNEDLLKTTALTIDGSGKSEVRMNIEVRDLRINSSNSMTTLTGSADYITVKATGAASVNAIAIECDAANIETTTNAECFISAKEKLDLKATTNSNIFYKGIPEILNVKEATLGKVQKL